MKKLAVALIAAVVLAGALFMGGTVVLIATAIGSGCTTTASATTASTTATGKLTAAQVAAYASAAGFSGPALITAVAITMPESGANSNSVQNGGPIGGPLIGVGLWQITPGTQADLDPLTNAQHAFAKYVGAGHSFLPWTTFTGGEFEAWIAWATAGVAEFLAGAPVAVAAPATCAATDAAVNGGVTVTKTTIEPLTPVEPGAPFCNPALSPDIQNCSGMYAGQCTWWAAYNHPISWSGNGGDWWANAAAKGVAETKTPTLGSIVSWSDSYPGSGGDGHVAIVIGVQASSITVSEMNYVGTGVVDERNDPLPDPYINGYITGS